MISGSQCLYTEPMEDLASAFLRGLRKHDWVDGDRIATEAFVPSHPAEAAPGGKEASINWHDDDAALARARRDKNAQHGLARVELGDAMKMLAIAGLEDHLKFERRQSPADPENQHHGNIVYMPVVYERKPMEKQLAAILATIGRLY